MSNPLEHFGLERAPFAGALPTSGVIGTRALRKVVSRIQAALRDGNPRIAVSGEEGVGKSCLAAALPGLFAGSTRVALIDEPGEDWRALRTVLARAWSIEGERLSRSGLLAAAAASRLVLVVDRGEQAPESLLGHLDALQEIRDDDGVALVTLIVFVRPSEGLLEDAPPVAAWLEGSAAAHVLFDALPADAVGDYIDRHLRSAGHRGHPLFTPRAALAIHAETGGLPGAIAALCEKLLVEAAARRLRSIDEPFVRALGERASGLAERVEREEQEVWDDADHHPRETPSAELLLENAIPRFPAPNALHSASEPGEASAPSADPTLEAYLSAPPTAAELRAIRGGFVRRNARSLTLFSTAIAIGGFLLAALRPDPSAQPAANSPASSDPNAPGFPHAASGGTAEHLPFDDQDGPPILLVRPRGPIRTEPTSLPALPPKTPSDTQTPGRGAGAFAWPAGSPASLADEPASSLSTAGELAVDDPDLPPARHVALEDTEIDAGMGPDPGAESVLPDLRPADLPPPAGFDGGDPLP